MARSSGKRGADIDHLRTTFASLDPDDTGYIGYQELRTLAQTASGMDEAMVPELLDSLDRDKDGRISFEDLEALFELQRDTVKRQKIENTQYQISSRNFCNNDEYSSPLGTTPSEITSGSPEESSCLDADLYQPPAVVLRHKKPLLKLSTSQSQQGEDNDTVLSAEHTSPGEADLATQMRYITNIPESPRLNRQSKVLSWISESEDMFEDTGASREYADGLLSPPMSPTYGCRDEAAHVCSIIEGVCQTQDIGKNAVKALCSHVHADQEEEEELLGLLENLDKKEKGYVSIDEFVYGLQSMHKSASVVSFTTPLSLPNCRPFRRTDMPAPKLSEPFSSTPNNGKSAFINQSSTPLPPSRKHSLYIDSSQLTVLDPNNSGFVGIETLAEQWHRMGVEPPHNQSLEDALRESLPVDAARRVSLSEVTTSLECAVLNEDKSHPTLRQAALLTFKGEITQLRNQLHQVLMERDRLQSNLQRTAEECKRLVREGDEQVERITKESEIQARENEQHLSERIREIEREKEEEAKRLQELIDLQKEKHNKEIEELKSNEERLKIDLKIIQNETRRQSHENREETQGGLCSDHSERLESEKIDSDMIRIRIEELEMANTDLLEQNKDLQDCNTRLKDRLDEFSAEIERYKHRQTSYRRKLQRQHSEPHRLNSAVSQLDERKISRPRSGKRPLSASRRTCPPSSLDFISENKIDTTKISDTDISSPVLHDDGNEGELTKGDLEELEFEEEESDVTATSSSDDGLFAKSTASLMEEIQFQDTKADIQKELELLRRENTELEESCYMLEQQLQHQQDQNTNQHKRQLYKRRKRQEELERRIQFLEDQQRSLRRAKNEIDVQLASTEDSLAKQLNQIHTLRDKLSQASPDLTDISLSSVIPSHMNENATEHSMETCALERQEESGNSFLEKDHLEKLQCEVNALIAERNQLVTAHQHEVKQIELKAKKEKQKLLDIEDEQNKTLKRLGKELCSSQLALEQYKNDAQSLENQLQLSRQEIKIKERDLQSRLQKMNLPAIRKQTQESEELTKLRIEKKHFYEVKNAEVKSLQDALNTEVSRLKECKTQLQEKVHEYQSELIKFRKDAEFRASSMQKAMVKKIEAIKTQCDIQVENTQQELKTNKLTTIQLEEKLISANKQCEKLLLDLQQEHAVTTQANQISELQLRPQEMISHADGDKQKQITMEQQLCNEIQNPQAQLNIREVSVDEMAVKEVDHSLTCLSITSPIISPSRHSYQSDYSSHEDIVTQMRAQLEDLQTCLVQQHTSPSKSDELTLVEELLEANAILQANLEKEQKERQRELAALKEKESKIQILMENTEFHNQKLNSFTGNVFQNLEQALESLHKRSETCICNCILKVEAANIAIAQLKDTMRKSHTKKRKVNDIDKWHERTHEALSTVMSQKDDLDTHDIRAAIVGFQALENEKEIEIESAMNEKDIEIETLRKEISVVMQQRDESQKTTDAMCIEMQLKEEDISSLKTQIYIKEEEIAKLEKKLQKVVNEPVEVVMQYMETAPLESVSDAVITSMQKDLQTGNQQSLQLVSQHKTEVDKLKGKLEMSMSESLKLWQQVYALKQAVQEQEAELRATMVSKENEKREREIINHKNTGSAHKQQQLRTNESEVDILKSQLYSICSQLISIPEKIDYSDLAKRAEEAINILFKQLSKEQTLRQEAEMIIGENQTEWQVQESQWQVEHEEEVRALRQRNSQLLQMLEDTRSQYQEYIAEQQRENAEFLQDLITKQASLEKELEIRAEEVDHTDSSPDEESSKDRRMFLHIIQQLCTEWQAPLEHAMSL